MVAQNGLEHNLENVNEILQGLGKWLHEAARMGTHADDVERHVWRSLLEMGYQLFGNFLRMQGTGDLGETFELEDGSVVTRLELHERRLVTIFGEYKFERYAYGTREGQKIELLPVDQRLNLPESEFSYVLQEWDQLLDIEDAFGRVVQTMRTVLQLKQSVDSLETMNQQMAEASEPFRESLPVPDPALEGEVLVSTIDNKGVPMVRPVPALPAGHRTKGGKANKKQHATIGCVYSMNPHVRNPKKLVEILFRERRETKKPPASQQRRYWAAMTRIEDGQTIRGQDEVIRKVAEEVAKRRRPGQWLVHLTDGQHSLETDRLKYLPTDARTADVLDLMHVLPCLWEAAHLFHKEASDEAREFVRERLLKVLEGQAGRVIGGLRQMGTKQGLRGAKQNRLRLICNFLEKNLHRMKYNEYLKRGFPIATGVIEGACRHVIKDRMERTGMRWKVPGAHAMLQLRTISANGHWEEFQKFRLEYENRRLYPHQTALREVAWVLAA